MSILSGLFFLSLQSKVSLTNFGLSVCFQKHQGPFEKGSTTKGKNLLPRKEDLSAEGKQTILTVASTENVSIPIQKQNIITRSLQNCQIKF